MASAEQVAHEHYLRQQRIVRRSVDRAQGLWGGLDVADLDGSWQAVAGGLVAAVTAGQREAAAHADPYVAAVLAAEGLESDPDGSVDAAAFAGAAADGRPLKSLLYEPVIETKWRLQEAGQSAVESLLGGLEKLLRAAATQVADAGRTAAGASIAGNRTINGYVRVVNPPACARCIILAGTEYGWNRGFQRHPRCDCVHMPTKLVARGRHHRGAFDARRYFDSLSAAEQNRIFTASGAQAVRDGASLTSVVNARRGMYTASAYGRRVRATRDSATRRGQWYRAERQRAIQRGLVPRSGRGFRLTSPRLLPEEIYDLAGSRSEAITLLRRFGYLH
ncbi:MULTISPECIES: hypothetical protein [Streptomyces]|uniref:Uncharacterized protein n=3 Tax=Streptomyces rimosus TaxID=1927 RepID=L8EUD7_STRR1|nr:MULTISPECIES: hypothetical protein [Streptomyces]KOG84151.1 hypothetical protein ADK78_00705 [Kitasatospora aureofaciens]MYT44938.1 hypothetical protein [Streptomyces sp. SID5471]KUJ43435.1 hypothetical protein ADK46_00690 [Streptomyces rimosus subsp. rimosus]QDA07196.1 hypothetical protein CTZ40_29050 [Streptomyces rimosus]QEV78474.1 hypothetical protein CP984_29010 [Streptomyces rimosus]